ncbi:Na(+)/H(+) antiporter subunit D [Ferrimonas pelagia]|uniref:Na(+)/H(+) antiporter subunit D n=1 Tax=Ferrimonas pelagia TaxID=1177826 RepID=A0ABP9FHP3_9GAMM
MIEHFPPGLLLVIIGLLLPFVSVLWKRVLLLAGPMLVLLLVWTLPLGTSSSVMFLEYQLAPLEITVLGRLFATVFALMAFAGALYALNQAKTLELSAAMIYAGSAIGVALCGDLFSMFVFWEVMTLGSTLVLWAAGTDSAWKASFRYLMVHLFGGVVLMVGIVAHVYASGSIEFGPIGLSHWSGYLILAGFLVNAGAPPFSAWIADAYPEASPSGSVFLSAFTTKTAVFTLMICFAGTTALIYIGLYMVFYGIIYALLENDMRRILAYSIVNQVGFMITAIGIGSELALNGAAAHAFAHIIYKGLLLMAAGSVLYQTGKRKCSDLGGLFQSMPLTTLYGTIGALAISSVPFTSGFVTKSLETAAAAHERLAWVWFLLLAASAGVFLHAGIKFPWFVFFQKDSGLRPADPPATMRWAMALFSALCIGIGLVPQLFYQILPYPVSYQPYTLSHLVTQFQLLLFAGAAFFVLLPMMKRTLTISLDFDWFYRRLFPSVVERGSVAFVHWDQRLRQSCVALVYRMLDFLALHLPEARLSRTRLTSSMVMWVAVILTGYLTLSFV